MSSVAMVRILVADPIAADGIERLRAAGHVDVTTGLTPKELLEQISAYDALVVRSETKVTRPILEAATRLRVVARAGVGIDNIDVDAATERGILVVNAPTGNTIAAAEHAVALMLSLVRNIAAADQSLRAERWERSRFLGTELRGKTLGVLGLGKIGGEVARIASQGLQMTVLAYDPVATPEHAAQSGAELTELSRLLAESDVVTVHAPLNDSTRGMLGATQFAAMKKGARIVNAARGGLVDEEALATAISSGHLAGAAIDVFATEPPPSDHPLLHLPQVVVTPHLGASTQEAQANVAYEVADEIVRFLEGGMVRQAVNMAAIRPEEMARLHPYLELAAQMGSLAAQLQTGSVRRLVCSYSGELVDADTQIITAEALRGFFVHFTDERVNPINARQVARAHGVDVEERHTTQEYEHATTLAVEVVGKDKLLLVGSEFHGSPRITRINDFRVDMVPHGNFLVGTHEDRPGVIAAVSTVMAEHDINIAGIYVGRDQPRGHAVMFMEVDEDVSAELVDQVRQRGKLTSLHKVRL